MTHVSLFAGVGGIDLAAEWAGFETIAQVEQNPYCIKVLERHWPGVHRCTDIREFPDRDYSAVTLVSGGFPCQPFSQAGKRRGTDDDRFLWPEMLRVIREIEPRWVLAENVLGLLSLDGGVVFETVLSDLESAGYATLPVVCPAAGAGAPHQRQRVFIVAHAGRERDNGRCGRRGSTQEAGALGRSTRRGAVKDAPDADSEQAGWSAKPRRECSQRESQSRMGGTSSRLPPWMDGDWERGVPRVMTGAKNRVARLRALGNAVVPQQVYPILQAIAEVENE